MVYLHLCCFELKTVWEERAKSFTCVWHKRYQKERPSAVNFKLLDSNKSLFWVTKIKSDFHKEVENSMHKNSEI